MPGIEYLCVDDQQDRTVNDLLASITRSGGPKFFRTTPIEVGEQIKNIIHAANAAPGKFGLLLDLRLDMEANEAGDKVPYRGPTLAQELRTRMAEGEISHPFPIVLWSVTNKLDNSFRDENTSHDLFDAVYGKDGQVGSDPTLVAREMVSLTNGYEILYRCKNASKKNAARMMGLAAEDSVGVYAVYLDELKDVLRTKAIHQMARLILVDLIQVPGLLVDERLLAARLGVDFVKCGADWEVLKGVLEAVSYKGPFCDGWDRWWWFKVEDWWSSLAERIPNIRRISAAERVNLLNAEFGTNLLPAKPIEAGYSDRFFAVCAGTEQPLDPVDGFRVVQSSKREWHDVAYVSSKAALNRINKKAWGRIDPMDRQRFDSLKEGGRNGKKG
ncbi:hypothetical protein ACU8YE_11035 [Ralstonia sp. VS2407]